MLFILNPIGNWCLSVAGEEVMQAPPVPAMLLKSIEKENTEHAALAAGRVGMQQQQHSITVLMPLCL